MIGFVAASFHKSKIGFAEIHAATNDLVDHRLSSSSWRCNLRGKEVVVLQRNLRRRIAKNELSDRLSDICRRHHGSIINLLGASVGSDNIYLVYEYVNGASLADCLRNPNNPNFTVLSNWTSRIQIPTDIAHGLHYIHNETGLKIQNYIESLRVIVTKPDFNAKICHLGTAQLCGETDERATIYMSPEFQASGIATQKSDVFAFGVVMLELISGEELEKYSYNKHTGEFEGMTVVESAKRAFAAAGDSDVEGRLRRWMDRRVGDSFPVTLVEKLTRLALECVQDDPVNRPEMGRVAGIISQLYLESNEWSTNIKRLTPMERLLGGETKNVPSKTKIVCTLGPASKSVEMMEKLLKAGMSVARFNFSQGSHEYHQEILNNLTTAMKNTGILCALMLDTKGPTLTEKDKEDILQWGIPNKINIIAVSFVRKGSDLDEVRELLGVHAKSIMLMSKVENQEGVANVDEIMEKTDAFMVAGGNLEMDSKAQKRMIDKANALGKPIVIATQMLESITDITNAVLDGTDCVMLCGETATGAHPETAVLTMSMICKDAEVNMDYEAAQEKIKEAVPLPLLPLESSAASAVLKARSVNAKAIVVLTEGGYTAELVAKYRPSVPILSVVPQWAACAASRGLIYRGVIPLVATGASESAEVAIRFAIEFGKKEIFKAGDSVVALQMIDGSCVVELLLVD